MWWWLMTEYKEMTACQLQDWKQHYLNEIADIDAYLEAFLNA